MALRIGAPGFLIKSCQRYAVSNKEGLLTFCNPPKTNAIVYITQNCITSSDLRFCRNHSGKPCCQRFCDRLNIELQPTRLHRVPFGANIWPCCRVLCLLSPCCNWSGPANSLASIVQQLNHAWLPALAAPSEVSLIQAHYEFPCLLPLHQQPGCHCGHF